MNWVLTCAWVVLIASSALAHQVAPRGRFAVNGVVRGPVVVNGGIHGSGLRRPGMRGPGMMRGPRIYTNVHQGPDSLHRPWAGSGTYDKNLNRSKDGGRSDFQRERDSTLDTLHHEEDRARSIRNYEESRAEKMQEVRNNKAIIEANARVEAAERKAREAERSAEIANRAAELENNRRAAEHAAAVAARHDEALAALKPCRAYNDNGTPCRRKANPGIEFCYLHVGYSGRLQGARDELSEANSNGCLSSSEHISSCGSAAPVSTGRKDAAPLVVSDASRDLRPQGVVSHDAPSDSLSQSKPLSENLLVIIVVSLLVLLGIGILGGLALGFYAIRLRRGKV